MSKEFKFSKEMTVGITGNRYTVTTHGKIKDSVTNTTINSGSTELVEIVVGNKSYKVKPEVVIALGYKPMYRADNFWFNWSVIFIDLNNKNFHPSNLMWKPPKGGQPCPAKADFYVIPTATEFAVNREGTEAYSRKHGVVVRQRHCVKKKNQVGYYLVINAKPDSSNSRTTTLSMHKAVALAVIDYKDNMFKITVNHKNGIKHDNRASNLEWATYSQNNLHARDTGLCNTRIKAYVKDYKTGEVVEYKSLSAVGDALNTTTVYSKLPRMIDYRYWISLVDLGDNWPDHDWYKLEQAKEDYDSHRNKLTCAAYDIVNNIFYTAHSPGKLRETIPFNKDRMLTAMVTDNPWPVDNYIMFFADRPKKVRKFTEEEIKAFKDKHGIKNPVRATYPDGSSNIFINADDFISRQKLDITAWRIVMKLKDNSITIDGVIYKLMQV